MISAQAKSQQAAWFAARVKADTETVALKRDKLALQLREYDLQEQQMKIDQEEKRADRHARSKEHVDHTALSKLALLRPTAGPPAVAGHLGTLGDLPVVRSPDWPQGARNVAEDGEDGAFDVKAMLELLNIATRTTQPWDPTPPTVTFGPAPRNVHAAPSSATTAAPTIGR